MYFLYSLVSQWTPSTHSTFSHLLSLATDPGLMLSKQKPGYRTIGVDLLGGGYSMAADPFFVQTDLLTSS